MEPDQLAELWPRNNDRPQFVRNHRDLINDVCCLDDPVPTGSNYEIRQWLQRYRGVVTRQLNELVDSGTETDDAEEVEQ